MGIAIVFLGTVGIAKVTGHWETNLPIQFYQQLIPDARKISHPGRWFAATLPERQPFGASKAAPFHLPWPFLKQKKRS